MRGRQKGSGMQDIAWTQRQRECVEFPGPQLLVSGPPGTGKTLVLLKRAIRLSHLLPHARVLVVAFNKALAQYARDQLRLNGAGANVQAVHFHGWAFRQLRDLGIGLQIIPEPDRRLLLRQVLDTLAPSGSSLLARSLDWWRDELDWIKGNALSAWDHYRQVERTGRGHGLQLGARQLVWAVYEGYQQQLQARGQVDYRDFALLLLRAWNPVPDAARVSHLLIDEAQDFRYAELRVLSPLPGQTLGILARTWETLHRLEPALRAQSIPYDYLREQEGAVSTPGIKLTTFHSAKGLEFGDVLLIGLSEGLFPPPLGHVLDTAEGEQEEDLLTTERRLLYVAMTRTRHALYLGHGRQPTRFL